MAGLSSTVEPESRIRSEPIAPRSRRAVFADRIHAGEQLANNLGEYSRDRTAVVLSVSRGGAIIGSVVAETLGIPHYYYMVKAIPWPQMPRLSLGSVAGDGSARIDNAIAQSVGIAQEELLRIVKEADQGLLREQAAFHLDVPGRDELDGRTLVVVDDGCEAGDTMREAIMHLRHCHSECRIVVAVPVCLADLKRQLQRHASVVDIVSPVFTGSVARWYAGGATPVERERRKLEQMFEGDIGQFDID
ncbi:hypothetical protein EC988_005739 [Linderina pennispora]|nr:hypothetical protein EC988_005739 [Linderina pennispora]